MSAMYIALMLWPATLWVGEPTEEISTGNRVELKEHLVPNRYVVFDFYAEWCGPCRKWSPLVAKMAEKHPNKIVVKKINIRNWGTPVAIQHNIRRLPYFVAYSPKGKRLRRGHPREVMDLLEKKAKREKW